MLATHFTPALFGFLRELAANNERGWFEANRGRYRADVRDPMLDFIADFAPHLAAISPHFVADPRPNGGSLFRPSSLPRPVVCYLCHATERREHRCTGARGDRQGREVVAMPYHVDINLQSPYQPGTAVLDYPTNWYEPTERHGRFWHGNRIYRGSPLDSSEVPHRFLIKIPAARLPDMFEVPAGPMVSDVLRDRIEELEPGVHRFFEAEITAKGGERPEKRYWLFQICNLVDAIDEQKSVLTNVGRKFRTYSRDGLGKGVEPKLVFREEGIAGMCVWMDERYSPFFVSDELFEFVQQHKLTKLDSWKVYAE